MSHTIHGTGIFAYMTMVDFHGQCRQMCHTWMLWVCETTLKQTKSGCFVSPFALAAVLLPCFSNFLFKKEWICIHQQNKAVLQPGK